MKKDAWLYLFFWASNSISKTTSGKNLLSDCFSVKCIDYGLGITNYLAPIKYIIPQKDSLTKLPIIKKDNTLFLHFSSLYGCKKRFMNDIKICKGCPCSLKNKTNDNSQSRQMSPSLLSPEFDNIQKKIRAHFHVQIQQKKFPENIPRSPSPPPPPLPPSSI